MDLLPVTAPPLPRLIVAFASFALSISAACASTAQLTITPNPLSFARVLVGHSLTVQVKMKNAGTTSVTVSSMTNKAPGFSVSGLKIPLTLPAGKTVTFNVIFTPKVAGSAHGNITLQSNASNKTLYFVVRGLGILPWSLRANPASLNFGKVAVGKSLEMPIALTNSGSSSVTVSQASIAPAGFSLSGLPLPLVIAGGHSFTFHIRFTARAMGAASGSLLVSNPTSTILKIPLSGTGVSGLNITPSSLNFGKVIEGTSSSIAVTLSATGASVTVSSESVSNPLFVLSGLKFPFTIPAGRSVPFTLTFSPVAVAAAAGSLSFVSNAGNSPTKSSLTGSGIPPYSVSLTWTASTSSVVGYNVYRRQSATKYKKLNSAPVPETRYTDGSVSSGTTYYYETTAVNSAGAESVPSNQATAIVP